MNLHFSGLGKSYNGKTVFENIAGQINRGEKIGLVGANGVGKTTLARLLAGQEACDQGEIRRAPANIKILYVEQYPEFDPHVRVYEEISQAAAGSHNKLKDEKLIKRVLHEVGLDESKWEQQAVSLSGGEKTKLALGRAMVRACDFDLIIFDEPTNHLDLQSYDWLESFVRSLDQPVLVISHDRLFLDHVVNKIWELTARGLNAYEGNYSAYKAQKEIELKSIAREYDKQQLKIQHLKQVISDRKSWYQSAHKAAGQNDFYRSKAKKHAGVLKAKEKELERIERSLIDKPEKPVSPAFEVINKGIAGKKLPPYLVQVKELSKVFGENVILQDVSLNIKRKDKIALIGKNGAGKTTLLKILCGLDQDYSGTVKINPSVKLGYFAQALDHLNYQAAILDDVLTAGAAVDEARLLLACLLFRGDDVYHKIAGLSMGEKGRVAFAKLILSGANMLVLDELTNYMDVQSKEKIEAVLEDFGGSIIFVSHDRYFIQRLANRILIIENEKLQCFDGDYEYYLTKCREQKEKGEIGPEYESIADDIRQLECELAFLGGKLNETLEEEEKEALHHKFLTAAKQLNQKKDILRRLTAKLKKI